MPTVKNILKLAVAGALLIQIMVALSKQFWFFELFSHYAHYYIFLGLIVLAILLIKQMWKSSLILLTLVCINLAAISPYLEIKDPNSNPTDLTILTNNFFYLNEETDELVDLISIKKPDIIVIHEASELWRKEKERLRQDYPYILMTEESGIHGIVIASKIEGKFQEIPLGTQTGLLITTDDFQVLGIHPNAPLSKTWANDRNQQFQDVSDFVQSSKLPSIIVGDLNTTPWSPYFQSFLKNSGLQDSRLGFGIVPTWDAHKWWFALPIDYALVTPDIGVVDFYRTEATSSDHYPILVELDLP